MFFNPTYICICVLPKSYKSSHIDFSRQRKNVLPSCSSLPGNSRASPFISDASNCSSLIFLQFLTVGSFYSHSARRSQQKYMKLDKKNANSSIWSFRFVTLIGANRKCLVWWSANYCGESNEKKFVMAAFFSVAPRSEYDLAISMNNGIVHLK